MERFYQVVLVLSIIVAVLFSILVFITGKGDGMSSGGGAVRTSFKGKASFDDQISWVTFGLGCGFMVLMVVLDVMLHKLAH